MEEAVGRNESVFRSSPIPLKAGKFLVFSFIPGISKERLSVLRFIVKQSPLEDLHEELYDLTTAFSANEFYILHRSRGVKFLPES